MSLITKKNNGQFKASGLPSVDWENPLSSNLTAAFYFGHVGNQIIDLVTGRLFSQTNASVVTSTTVEGPGLKGVSGGLGGYVITNSNISPTTQLTVFARLNRLTDSAARGRIINTQDAAGASHTGYGLSWVGTTGNYEFEVGNGAAFTFPTAAGATVGSPISLMGTYDNVTVSIYLNGILKNTGALAGPIVYPSYASVPPLLFNFVASAGPTMGTQNFPGHIYVVYVFNRCLNALEANILHLNPYGLLIYPQDEIWSAIHGSTSYSPILARSMSAAPGGSRNFVGL